MIIGVGGSLGSGKSILFEQCLINRGYREIELASPMKEFLADWYKQDKEVFYRRDLKESRNFRFIVDSSLIDTISEIVYSDSQYLQKITPFDDRLTVSSPRELLQLLGTDILRERDQNIHLFWSFKGLPITGKEKYYVQALRFPNEVDFIKNHNGITLYINRENNLHSAGRGHKSESSVLSDEFDYVIENNGSLKDFFIKVQKIISESEEI